MPHPSHRFRVELLGGPADGWQRDFDKPLGRMIGLPCDWRADRSADVRAHGDGRRHLAGYELAWRRFAIDEEGIVVVRMAYGFVGWRRFRNQGLGERLAQAAAQATGIGWLAKLAGGWRRPLDVERLVVCRRERSKRGKRKELAKE
ncbi:MAG TPA: hypothetical protein VMF30_19545 [Pirellulales bacterium]|nr:hypothetical protein [Pirellulales bacterium]